MIGRTRGTLIVTTTTRNALIGLPGIVPYASHSQYIRKVLAIDGDRYRAPVVHTFQRPQPTTRLVVGNRYTSPLFRRVCCTHRSYSSSSPVLEMSNTQAFEAPLTRCATFLVLAVNAAVPEAVDSVRSALGSVGDLAKNVAIRSGSTTFSVTVGIGSDVWDGVTGLSRPAELHPFVPLRGATHTAPSTPGDLLFHIRGDRRDLCFEFERQLLDILGNAVTVIDETVGFRYFDARDLLGFVDGTANPVGREIPESVTVTGSQDAAAEGGTYVVIQKYVHNLGGWKALSTENQEKIIGRTKFDNIELADSKPDEQKPHKQLATVTDSQGNEYDILRDNMPFGSPGSQEYGTYFIGYSRHLWVTEKMLERMFIGDPPGQHDKLLDYSKALTGCVFFVPSADVLDSLGD